MQQQFRMPPMGQGQQRPTGSLTDVGQRRPPRPTHVWDPERGVIPLNPNAPAKFVPPPPPEVVQAYTQGMARRRGVARDLGDPSRPRLPSGRPIGLSGLAGIPGPTPTDAGAVGSGPMGINPVPEHELLAMEGIVPTGGPDAGPTILSMRPSGPIDMPMPRSPIMSPHGDVELRHFWPTLPPQNIPMYDYTKDWKGGSAEVYKDGEWVHQQYIRPPSRRY